KFVEYQSDLAMTWALSGKALWKLGRREEAVVAYERALEYQRKAFDIGLSADASREIVTGMCSELAHLLRELNRPPEAAATSRKLQQLWPENPRVLYVVACDLARCIPLVGKDKPDLTPKEQSERRQFCDQAMEALRQAVKHGFTDVEHLKN